jgi:cellobiose-specific phosphotransferase system component IIB
MFVDVEKLALVSPQMHKEKGTLNPSARAERCTTIDMSVYATLGGFVVLLNLSHR